MKGNKSQMTKQQLKQKEPTKSMEEIEEKDSMGVIYHISKLISNYFLVNIIWLAFNIPLAFIIALALLGSINFEQIILVSTIVFILAPLLFFPATTAMFAVIRSWVLKKSNDKVLKPFWNFYKENFVKSVIGGFIFSFIWMLYIVDFYFLTAYRNPLITIVFILLFFFLFGFTLIFLCSIVHFTDRLPQLFKNAFFITIGHPFLMIGLTGLNGLILYLSLAYAPFLYLICTGSLMSYFTYTSFNRVFVKLEEKEAEANK